MGGSGWLSREAAEGMRKLTQKEAEQDPYDVVPYRAFLRMMQRIFLDGIYMGDTFLLDVGCGVGHYAKVVGRFYPLIEYRGCDVSKHMIEFAKADHGEERFFICDVTKLTAGADIILASSLIEPCPNWRDALAHLLSLNFQWLILHRVRVFNDPKRLTKERTYTTIYGTDTFEVVHNQPELMCLIADGGGVVTHTIAYQVEPKTQLLCLLVEKTK